MAAAGRPCLRGVTKGMYYPLDFHYVYVATNEQGHASAQAFLNDAEFHDEADTAVIISGLAGIDLASLMPKIKKIVSIDIEPQVAFFMKKCVIPCVSTSISKEKCLYKINLFIKEHAQVLFNSSPGAGSEKIEIQCLQLKVYNKTSFMSSDERYTKIRDAILGGGLEIHTLCFTKAEKISAIKDSLTERSHRIGLLYLSNIRYYMMNEAYALFIKSVTILADNGSYIADCKFGSDREAPKALQVFKGETYELIAAQLPQML